MIGLLRGLVAHLQEDGLILDVSGVGYLVFASAHLIDHLRHRDPSLPIQLYIETHVREDHIWLYGFESREEQAYFTLLTSVQGVGAKMALSVLSLFRPQEIATILLAQDSAALTRVSGIGKRIAERITTELKNKLPAPESFGSHQSETPHQRDQAAAPASAPTAVATKATSTFDHNLLADAVTALTQLGYERSAAHKAVYALLNQPEEEDQPATLERLIPKALQSLSH